MFVSDKIVFVELQKTGCTHIRNLLKELVGGNFIERHNQADPALFSGQRTFLGSIRDPWDWHVSLWAYCCDGRGDFFSNVSTPGIRVRKRGWKLHPYSTLVDFMECRFNRHAAEWKRTFRNVDDPGAFRQWLSMLHDETYWPDVGEGYWRCAFARNAGLLTYRYLRIFTCKQGEIATLRKLSSPQELVEHERRNCFVDHFIRNENLESDLLEALRLARIEVPAGRLSEMRSRPRTNASSRKRGPDYYYDDRTEKLVGDRDRLIVDKFGYVPPSAREPAFERSRSA